MEPTKLLGKGKIWKWYVNGQVYHEQKPTDVGKYKTVLLEKTR